MNSRDRRLGMGRAISRRDFLNGVSVTLGAALLPACTRTGEHDLGEQIVEGPSAYDPPTETGMRGSHPGSFEVVHATVRGQLRYSDSLRESVHPWPPLKQTESGYRRKPAATQQDNRPDHP